MMEETTCQGILSKSKYTARHIHNRIGPEEDGCSITATKYNSTQSSHHFIGVGSGATNAVDY